MDVVGVPLIMPVLELMLNPEGKPVADHVMGAVPPPEVMVVLGYATFTSPAGSDEGPVIVGGPLGIVTV